MKRLLVALCIVLCMASSAFCIDPFKVNQGGFGPKIKGLQLGQKMSLLDIVVWRMNFKGLPFTLTLKGLKGVNESSYISVKFEGEGVELKNFEITKAGGVFKDFQNQTWKLGDLLSKIEESGSFTVDTLNQDLYGEGLIGYYFPSAHLRIVFDEHDKDRRIRRLQFFVSDFGADSLTDEEFIQMFVNAYADVPSMSTERKWNNGRSKWVTSGKYRNPSKGWQVIYDGFSVDRSVVVEPIITQTSFD